MFRYVILICVLVASTHAKSVEFGFLNPGDQLLKEVRVEKTPGLFGSVTAAVEYTGHPDVSRVTYIKVVDHSFGQVSGDVSVSYHKTMLGERYGATVTLTSKILRWLRIQLYHL